MYKRIGPSFVLWAPANSYEHAHKVSASLLIYIQIALL